MDKPRATCCAWEVKDNLPWINKASNKIQVDDKYLQEKETTFCGRTIKSDENVKFGEHTFKPDKFECCKHQDGGTRRGHECDSFI